MFNITKIHFCLYWKNDDYIYLATFIKKIV